MKKNICSIMIISLFIISCATKGYQNITDYDIIELEIVNLSEVQYCNDYFFILDKEGRNIINIYDSDFETIDSFIERGRGPSELIEPTDFMIYYEKIYILDKQSNCIKVYSLLGKHLETIYLEDIIQPNSFTIIDDNIYLTNMVVNNEYLISVYNIHGNKIRSFGDIIDSEDLFKKVAQNASLIEKGNDMVYSYFLKQAYICIYNKDGSLFKKVELLKLPFKTVDKYKDEELGTFIVQDMSILNNETFVLIGGGLFENEVNSLYLLNDINNEKYFQIENLKGLLGLDNSDFSFCNIFQDDDFIFVTGPKWGKIIKISKKIISKELGR
ncbi:MAG: hypothetical protein PHR06_03230 [Candidatus Cloacimonetes bacterium]|nr:hypothetical protein [Candidatus Cloacimonadota bacterium]